MKANGFIIKEGRTNNQYINTSYDLIDSLMEYADCETLGFYIGFKRFINRKDNTKENQITYSQKYLEKQLNVGWRKYYKHLKILFNTGLCDIEKVITVKFFINYNIEGRENPLVEKSIVYFSTLEGINISLKDNIENLIAEKYPEIPKELIKVVDVVSRNSYIFHDYPPIEILEDNDYKFIAYRDWEEEMENPTPLSHYGKGAKNTDNNPVSQNGEDPSPQSGEDPISQNGELNIINKLYNNINKSSNIIINQSIKGNKEKNIIDKKTNDRLIDFDKQLEENNFKTYDDLINYAGIDKKYFDYPYTEWIDAIKKAIWEMYHYDDTSIRGKKISRYDAISKLQSINLDMVRNVIDKVIEKGKEELIKYPIAYLKTTILNEIDEFSAKIQSQVNYDLSDGKHVTKQSSNKFKTRFHNFKQRTDYYSEDELEAIARRKRESYMLSKGFGIFA